MRDSRTVTILVVDDDEVDVMGLRRAFAKLRIINPVHVANDGAEAWEMLDSLPRPFLVITDINMPRMSGLELLQKIRESEKFHSTVVFVLTTSDDDEDKLNAYNLNATGYILKSDLKGSFTRAIELVENYWKVVELPA